jgi:carboxylesterase type B
VEDALWDNATIGEGVRQTYGFPPESVTDTRMFVSPTVTDYLFYCSGRWAAQGMAASVAGTSTNIFVNFFDYIASWNDWVFGEHMPYCVNEVCHAQDLAAIFFPFYAAPANLNPPTPKPDEIALANMVQRMWGNFARTGNPSIPTLNYPAYNATSTFVMNVSIPTGIIPEFRNHYCDFWATAGYYHF